MVVAPVATRAGDEEPGQPGLAEPDHRVRISVTGQKFQRGVAVVRAEYRIPGRAEELDEGVEASLNRGAALDHRETLLGQPPQRISWALPAVGTQSFRVQQRAAGPKAPSRSGRFWRAWSSTCVGRPTAWSPPSPLPRRAGETTRQARSRRFWWAQLPPSAQPGPRHPPRCTPAPTRRGGARNYRPATPSFRHRPASPG